NFRLGNKIINLSRMYVEDMRTNKNQSAAVNWRWRKNGQETEIPRAMNESAGASYNALISDRYVESGNFLRFQYLQLSYNVPTAKLERYGLSSLNFAASVNNLFVLTRYKGLDPEHSAGGYSPAYDNSQTPRSRSFTVSVSLGF
ncbi:MAG: SusC/RagA family TonB-linked outer membrane protein, partial [Alloprevotella sp.]|nr:SusC/RagA family TonB-linked outer membrane protein [Alloprevotella sp.]